MSTCPPRCVCSDRVGTAWLRPVCREAWSASHLRPEVGFFVDMRSTGWIWFSARTCAPESWDAVTQQSQLVGMITAS